MSEDRRDKGSTRRRFCQITGLAASGAAAAGSIVLSADFLEPRALFEPPTRFTLGPPENMEVGDVLTKESFHAYVVRRADGFRALSSVCPHLGCITRYQAGEGIITCPCHGSRFDLDGEVLAGPAPGPLRSLEIAVTSRGEIEVDTAREAPPGTVYKL